MALDQPEQERSPNLEERLATLEEQRQQVDERLGALEQFFRPSQEEQRQRQRYGRPHEPDIGKHLARLFRLGEELEGLEVRISSRLQDQLQAELQTHEAAISGLSKRFLEEMDNLRAAATATAQQAVTTANLRLQMEEFKHDVAVSQDTRRQEQVGPATKAKAEGDGQSTAARWAPWRQKMGAMEDAVQAMDTKELQLSPLKSVEHALDHQASFLASHEAEIRKLKAALSYDAAKKNPAPQSPLLFQQGESQNQRRRKGELQVFKDKAEWFVRDALARKMALPRGQAIDSPPFDIDAPGVGTLRGLILRFYPSGGLSAWAEDTCSLYLVHPFDMPWSRYELSVGGCVKGPFDPIFGGSDDFCGFFGSLEEDETGTAGVMVGVKFLPPSWHRP